MDIDLRHFDDISPVSRGAWEDAVAKALGALSLERLQAVTVDGIAIPPLAAPRADRDPQTARGAGVPWSIIQRVRLGDAAETNAVLLDELVSGADGVDLVLNPVPVSTPLRADDWKLMRVLEGVYLDMISVHLTVRDAHLPILEQLLQVVASHDAPKKLKTLHVGLDPYANAVAGYAGLRNQNVEDNAINDILALHAECAQGGSALSARGQEWHAVGASELQQIAIAVATGILHFETLSRYAPASKNFVSLANRIEFRLVADQNQFLTIAKLRAFRRLWALVLDSMGLPQTPAFVHVETAWRMTAKRDPWVNIIRSTIATFAAAVGGADAITTTPHTDLLGLPDEAARRLSRNVQTVLMDESNIHRVGDPAAGAGGIEALTDELAERAWDEVRRIEREGGLAESIRSGAILGRIAEKAETRKVAVARRREPITGVSTYPLLNELMPTVAAPLPPAAPPPFPPLAKATRPAEPWEALRDRSDAMLAATGRRPAIFLANLGTVASFTVRSTWAKNLFEAGGIEAETREGHTSAEAAAAAFKASGARIACLCSDDRTYATLAADTAAALKAAGAEIVFLAGKPKDGEEALRAAGVDRFVHEGLDVLALLTDLNHRLTAAIA
ncbi:methylmalonyl-CoA mutase family protein [Chthonobacter rhizosphaerae]|uniref:methylmalonyl-CoA mutase family protein n=1 Tax=Chthonobacter rhizosphaerae TaxID=2735553 RepID=UPI0015EED92A|nr:methylmalonyl-CoA mutase family protein [Chthonobacter rhizosphaerae]